jgi:hypothetical protein
MCIYVYQLLIQILVDKPKEKQLLRDLRIVQWMELKWLLTLSADLLKNT